MKVSLEKVLEELSNMSEGGLWDNIRAKRARGEKPAKKGDKDYPDSDAWKSAQTEGLEIFVTEGRTDEGDFIEPDVLSSYLLEGAKEGPLEEAEYQGRKVELNKPMQGDVAKFKVYVKDPKTGNVKKVNFGAKGMRIRKNNPKARKSFRARHNCDNPGPKTKARYWSCRKW